MANLGLSGLSTGLDTRALVSQLMAIERRPITLMEKTQAQSRAKIDLYRQINTKLVALQRAAQKVMGLSFNGAVAAQATATDPSKLSATIDASAASGSYNVDVLALARKQITGGGAFTAPLSTWGVSDASKYTPTVSGSAASGTYNINILNLAQAQVTGGGAFTAPVLSATPSNGNLTNATATSAAAPGTNAYAYTNLQHFRAEVTSGQDALANGVGTKTGVLTLTKADGTFVDINLTNAENSRATILAKIKATSDAFGITTTLNGSNQLVFTGSDGGDFTITGTSRTLDILGLQATSNSTAVITAGRTTTSQTAALASVTIGGVVKTASGFKDDFTATDLGLAGVSFSLAAGATNGSASTLTVTNTAGTLRITDDQAGTSKDVAITGGMTNANVRDAINAAGSGMTASLDGSGRLVLTGNTTGKTFTIADAGGGNALAAGLGIDSASKTTQAAQQASLTVNGGPAITSNTNTFTAPVPGVNLTATAPGLSTLTVVNNTGTIRITKDADGTFKDIAIASGATVNDVASAINAAGSGMTASVSAGKLTLTGGTAGESFTVGDAGGGNAFAASLGIDSASKTTQTAQQASISIDGGAPITSNSNTFTNPLTGVTINALALGSTTLDVQAGTVVTAQDAAEKKATLDGIRDLVSQFNDVLGFMKQQASYNSTTKKGGALLGDPLTADLRGGLTRMFTEVVDDTGTFRTAFSAGLELQRDGTIKLDEAKLQASLEADPSALKALFTQEDGLAPPDSNGFAVKTNAFGRAGVVGDGLANRLNGFIDSMISSASAYSGTDSNGIRAQGGLLRRISANEALIDDIDKRIEAYKVRLEKREETLLAKFNAMEKVVAMMRNQGNYLSTQLYGSFGGSSN
jgi:flagellar hook-associated protein 2